jgi:HTH-type transcriptional regulator/antitoxin MqsA
MKTSQCPICATGELDFFSAMDEIQYKGQSLSVEVEYAVCQHCGDEMILPEQINRNDCHTRDGWRKADGLLTGEEIAAMRKKLGITQQEAAERFGGGANAFSKYERGEVIQSQAMDNLMRLAMEDEPVRVNEWLRNHAGLQKPESKSDYGKAVSISASRKNRFNVPSNITTPIEDLVDVNYG